MEWQNLSGRSALPAAARTDGLLELSNQGRAFKQIIQGIEHEDLGFEDALFRVLPAPPGISGKVARDFKALAAAGLAFLTHGVVPQSWRRITRPTSTLVPLFYVGGLDLFFMRFERETEDDPEPDLVIHVVTIIDARDAWRDCSENVSEASGIDVVDYFSRIGLLTRSKVLTDNSRASWERYTSESTLVPDFERLLNQLKSGRAFTARR